MSGLQGAILYQSIMVFICAMSIVVLSKQKVTNISKYLNYSCCFALIQNTGYLLELLSNTVGEVKIAIKAEYIGSAFVTTYLLALIYAYCRVPLNKWVRRFFMTMNFATVISVWTMEYNPIYYSGYTFVTDTDFPHVELTRGFLYYIQMVCVFVQMLMCVGAAVYRYRKTGNRRYRRNCLLMFFPSLLPILTYVLIAFDIMSDFDFVPGTISMGSAIYTICVTFLGVFDGMESAHAQIIHELNEPVVIADQDWCFVEANESAMEIFPSLRTKQFAEKLDTSIFMHIHEHPEMNELTVGDKVYSVKEGYIHNRGKVQGYSAVLIDLSEERRRFHELEKLKLAADSANQAKSDFLAKMSHEIRTPINTISGMNEMILRESNQEGVKEYAQAVKSSTQSLLGIINDILDTAKIENGKMEIIPVCYNLGDMIDNLYTMMAIKAEEKQIQLRMEFDKTLPSVLRGDDIRIRQVLLNLLSNAVKYTHEGTVTFRISGEKKGSALICHYEVQDTGIGIREEDLPRLFGRFERIEEERNRHIQGTGLGMGIATNLLHLMGSRLEVESTYGEGSRFYFDLIQPIEDETSVDEARREKTYVKAPEQGAFVAPDARILVVDDNRMNRAVFKSLLKRTKIQITDLESGFECLDLVQKEHFDLIFMDHMMPEMDGMETLQKMQELSENKCKDTPIVVLTANAIAGAREEYLKNGFDDFLAKPIVPAELEAMVEKHLPEELVK